jgi:SAM-dependent methyltransferase
MKISSAPLLKFFNFSPRLKWQLGLLVEIRFWYRWIKTKGLEWPEEFKFRCDPNSRLQSRFLSLLRAPIGATVRILDVGAGPLTYIGKCWEGRTIQVIAVDPLAKAFNLLCKLNHIRPPVRTAFAHAENLVGLFPPNYFDLVYGRNSIDHSFDPLLAIQQMIAIVKPDCFVLLQHFVNEGERSAYAGLHQWNFFADNGDFFLSNPRKKVNITRELNEIAEVTCEFEGEWLNAKIRKK